jgi:inward rectifier potassium channel
LGSVASDLSRTRLVNRDGSFNLRRDGESLGHVFSPYHDLLVASWPTFLSLLVVTYLAVNLGFAVVFYSLGPAALNGSSNPSGLARFSDCFFFSVQTFAGIGYGRLNPATVAADVVVAIESVAELLGLALSTGLVFARFSRPTAKLLWSRFAVVGPYRETEKALMVRLANARRSQIVEVEATMIFTHLDGSGRRHYHDLELERRSVSFFPLSWTLVHPIAEDSPLSDYDEAKLLAQRGEFLVRIRGIDDHTSQTVHALTSYDASEVRWGERLRSMVLPSRDGKPTIDLRRLSDLEGRDLDRESASL